MAKALKINGRDNVAVVLTDVGAGETVEVRTDQEVVRLDARGDIPFGHKIALADLGPDQPIVKYGEEIGRARTAIVAGDWVHLHNVTCERGHEHDGKK